ncbi:Uncharacterised protein [uncultured archaeon]|nr:Uncharacterised protein [uncultured archaeon]
MMSMYVGTGLVGHRNSDAAAAANAACAASRMAIMTNFAFTIQIPRQVL